MNNTFLVKLFNTLSELLDLAAIKGAGAGKDFRCKTRNSGEFNFLAGIDRVVFREAYSEQSTAAYDVKGYHWDMGAFFVPVTAAMISPST